VNILKNKEIQFVKQFTQNLINSDIDVSISSKDDFIPWATSSFVDILHENKIFINTIFMTPEANLSKDYFSFTISAKSKNQTYDLNLMLISKLNLEDFDDLLNSNNIIIYQLEHRKSLFNADIMKFVCHFDFFNIYQYKNKSLVVLSKT
jgi:hypothetical protein